MSETSSNEQDRSQVVLRAIFNGIRLTKEYNARIGDYLGNRTARSQVQVAIRT